MLIIMTSKYKASVIFKYYYGYGYMKDTLREKSWVEVQADSFSFECRGCTKMKELEVELEELRLLVVAIVGREQGGCASSSGGGTVDDKVGKDTRDARESSPQPGRKLRGGKVTGRRETGRKETGGKTTGA